MATYSTDKFITRRGIVLRPEDVPYKASLTFNAGVIKTQDRYVMIFRNDYDLSPQVFEDFYAGRGDRTHGHTNMGLALSEDGVHFQVEPEPVFGWETDHIGRMYDPRLTDLGNGEYGLCFAMDTWRDGTLGGIAVTRDFHHFEIKSASLPENRNMVLFPEKIGGRYIRLERPFRRNLAQSSIWISRSPDLVYWGESKPLLSAREVKYCNHKIGPGTPPIKTPAGWLVLFHAVNEVDHDLPSWHRNWRRVYYTGAMLLDPDDPSKVIAVAQKPLLAPEAPFEQTGYRGFAIFATGLVREPDDSLKLYYSAGDMFVCLAESSVRKLLDFIDQYRQ